MFSLVLNTNTIAPMNVFDKKQQKNEQVDDDDIRDWDIPACRK